MPISAAGHPLGGETRAHRLEFGHRLEHAGQAVDRRPRHHGAAMRRARRPGRSPPVGAAPRAPACATRRSAAPVSVSSSAGPGRQHAAHDLVGQLQPQLLGARDLAGAAPARSTRRPARRCAGRRLPRGDPAMSTASLGAGSSIRLTCAATISPAFRKAHPGLHLPPDLARRRVAIKQRRGHRECRGHRW